MASPAAGLTSCTIAMNVYSGARQLLRPGIDVLYTIRDGNQKQQYREFKKSASHAVSGLPFFNNFGDNYTVIASASGYSQAGFHPVRVTPHAPVTVDLMLLRDDGTFDFSEARWDTLGRTYPKTAGLLAAGASDDTQARDRYTGLMEDRPSALACFFNLITAMSQIHLPDGTAADYLTELIWDTTFAQDRFFAWADRKMVDQVVAAAAHGAFAPEPGSSLFHPGATRSYKQVQFGEANVQLTFHEDEKRTIGGVECVIVEPDIDYYKDLLAHSILEVTVHKLTSSMSDPRQVYVLRWIAGRRAGVPNFEPPYRLV